MRLAEFNDLCQREWLLRPQQYGDVIELHLTDSSWLELARDVSLANDPVQQPLIIKISPGDLPAIRGGAVTSVVNPVTRSTVRIKGGVERDEALVSFGDWREPELVTP